MRLLIDTNILIPLEPTRLGDLTPESGPAAELIAVSSQGGHTVFVHPDTRWDLARDRDPGRRDMRTILLRKYPVLNPPPELTPELTAVVATAAHGSNDWVDNMMLAAVAANAVSYLVTEDIGIHRKARRAGLQERVATVPEMLSVLRNLFDSRPIPPPQVELIRAYQLRNSDPIFDGLKEDYLEFDDWLTRIKRQGRDAWVIQGNNTYAGLCIIKKEEDGPYGLRGKVLKICTLKVSPAYRGQRFGELLLKTIFDYVALNHYPYAYITVLEHHPQLLTLLEDFGFAPMLQTSQYGELVMVKSFRPQTSQDFALPPLDYHIRFGPPAMKRRELVRS